MTTKPKKAAAVGRPLSDYRSRSGETPPAADSRRFAEASSAEFGEGREAFLSGAGAESNPYKSEQGNNRQRYLFFQGYYDTSLRSRGLL